MKTISILGSTGSIGESTLRIVDQFPHLFNVVALAAGKRTDRLAEQAKRYRPRLVVCETEEGAGALRRELGSGVEAMWGEDGLLAAATMAEAEMVVGALVGAVGLRPTYAALKAGKDVAVANKETLVVAGEAVMEAAKASGSRLLPVDSEHSAVFQALEGRREEDVKRVILTASGGPFRGWSQTRLRTVTREQALKHPNWSMGPKITIDSATMMNKGLEVIEARWLFDLPPGKIHVSVHPQSIVHSMVEFVDGSLLAQMGVPDMRGPIGYALAWPKRLPMDRELALDFGHLKPLTFEEPDVEAFPCLKLAYEALCAGGTAPAVLNGANEVAVGAFLSGRIGFCDIAEVVGSALDNHRSGYAREVEEALEADSEGRRSATALIEKRSG